MRATCLMICIVFAFAACRSDSGGGGGGGGSPDAPVVNPSMSVKSVRMTQPTNGAMISFANVVVVAHVSSKKYGHVWVQDQGGGTYSGIQIYCNYGGTTPNCSMTQAQIDALAVGSVVNVTGTFKSFLLSTAPAGAQPTLEIDTPVITATGQSMPPVAVDVPAATIAKAQLASAAAEPYKGTYVHVTGPFPVSSIAATEFSSSCTDKSMPVQTGTTFSGFEATSGSDTLAIGLGFYSTMTYCLPCAGVAKPYPCVNPVSTALHFSTVSGIVEPEYSSNGAVYLQVSPVTDADLPKM